VVGAAVALALGFGSLLPAVSGGATIGWVVPWVPALGIELAFRIDGLSLLFALLITTIGAFVALYAAAYLRGHPDLARLQLLLLLFMLAMLGLVTADDLILLFVFWELTTVTSFFLVGFDHDKPGARRAALQALFVTGAGGLAMLAGFLLLGGVAGTYRISEITLAGDQLQADALYLPILLLILAGAFTKSAQFPFHFWLPGAMAAPTPVSAYLHSATMVKAGVFLLARLHPALGGTEPWFLLLTVTGAVTMLWASLSALRQSDLKLMLAWTTVMGLGTLVMFLGSSATVAIAAAVTFIVVHGLYKCALFLVVGCVDHAAGTRDLDRLGGLARAMPVTALAGAIAAFSMAGFPPFLGFIGKELKYEGALAIADEPLLIAAAAVAANAMMVSVAALVGLRTFFARRVLLPRVPHEAPPLMWLGPLILAGAGLAFGLLPSLLAVNLIQPAVSSVLGEPETVQLKLWHGINLPLMLSLLTVSLGTLLFVGHRPVRRVLTGLTGRLPMTGEHAYDLALDGLKALAAAQTRVLQNGALSRYLATVFTVFAVLVGTALVIDDGLALPLRLTPVPPLAAAAALLITAGVIVVVLSASRLLMICALGTVGVGIAILFLVFGAVDVAITQILVDTLFVVIIALVMLRLPAFVGLPHPGPGGHLRDAMIAGLTGVVMASLVLAVTASPLDRFISDYYEAASVPAAYGRNIVNVILVDFRALDTLGEIAVVAIAALGVVALVRLRPRQEPAT
jgi:multicomponent Na+:H+ antiporter subunit A